MLTSRLLPAIMAFAALHTLNTSAIAVEPSASASIRLSVDENRYLAQKKEITFCVDPDWMPFEAIRNGQLDGMTSDFIQMFSDRLGVPFRFVPTTNWAQSKDLAKAGTCDILPMIPITMDWVDHLSFTEPYLSYSVGIITVNELPFISGLNDLSDHPVGIVEGYSTWEYVEANFPHNRFVTVEGIADGLLKVSSGEISAFLIAVPVAVHNIKELGLTNLKVAGHIQIKKELRIGVSRMAPELTPILQKLTASLSKEDVDQVYRNWVTLRFEHTFNYDLLWKIGAAVLVVMTAIVLWNRKLRRLNKEIIQRGEELRLSKEQAERADLAKTKFLAMASHDLRQPLQALSLFAAALRSNLGKDDSPDIPKSRETLAHIEKSVTTLGNLLNSLLDISKLEAGVIQANIQTFPIMQVMDNIFDTYSMLSTQKGLDFRFVPSASTVASDSTLLQQIVENLVSNAVRYTASGRILLGCRHEGTNLRIEVWDTGIGISESDLVDIFEEFHQLDNPARQREKGLGLGLAIVKRTADLLGHPLKVRSYPNKGTVFSITVPKAEPASQEHLKSSPNSEHKDENVKPHTLMVIEDDPLVLESTVVLLQSWGYEVLGTVSSEEALALIRNRASMPDLIIFDYQLPGDMNGLQVFQAITQTVDKPIPGIIVSGNSSSQDIETFDQSGLAYMTKPIDVKALKTHLDTILT